MTGLSDDRNGHKSLWSTILKAGLLAGALDICLAFIYAYIKRGTRPGTVLQYISKVAFPAGPGGSTDPTLLTITGLLVHFAIAMVWTILFFVIYRALKLIKMNWIITAFIYGLFVWAMMSMVILPLWNGKPFIFKPESALINALILVVAIGMPLSFIAHRYFKKGLSA